MLSLIGAYLARPLYRWAAIAVSTVLVLGATYAAGYQSARSSCKQAAAIERVRTETVVQYVTKTVTVADTDAIERMRAQLASARRSTAALSKIIEEARRNAPVPAADCRLPDGVRDAINAALSAPSP